MRTIEAELHQLLLDLPGSFEPDAQSHIVAEAAASLGTARRRARLASAGQGHSEEAMIDALMGAIEKVAQDSADEGVEHLALDASGMSPAQVVRAASRLGDKAWGSHLDILNDDDLDAIMGESEREPWDAAIEDGTDRGDRFETQLKRHRSQAGR